jgi:hypothetical protein
MTASRITLPENFYDWNSAKLLTQPEPQYIFARLFLSAISAALPSPGAIGLDGRAISGSGAPFSAADRDRLELAKSLPSGLWALGVDFKGTAGHTVKINRPAFTNSTYTLASRKIAVGQSIGVTPTTFGLEQTHLTLERFAGPYDNTLTAVAPYAIEAFDASMGQHSMTSMIATHMARDFHRFLDAVHVVLGDNGTAIYPDGMSADNDATTAGSFPLTVEQLTRTHQLMNEADLPQFPDGKRIMFVSPLQAKQLKHDPEYQANSTDHPEFNILFGSYVSTVSNFHLFESNTLSRPLNGSSVPVHRAIAMAPNGFMGGMGRKPRVAASTDDNYGETGKVVWIADLAFGISDSRYFRSVRSA